MSERDERHVEALAEVVWAHTGEMCSDRDCGDGFGYHDCDSSEERRRGCSHIAQALLDSPAMRDLLAEERASVLREVADQTDSVGHHWSGAPALAFFALAGDFRARAEEETR